MATYEVTDPQGNTYEVTAPDDATPEQVMAYARTNFRKAEVAPQAAPVAAAPIAPDPVGPVAQTAGNVLRMGAQAAAALPLAAMDAGVALRNLAQAGTPIPRKTGPQAPPPSVGNYQLPSSMWNEGLNQIIPPPQGALGKGAEIVGAAVLGSRIPVPSAATQAPAQYAKEAPQAVQTLMEARKAGYVVPPATSNPTATNKVLEGIAGKLTTAQSASARNQSVTTNLAKRAIGLPEDAPLTLDAIKAVRQEASKAYDVVRGAGKIVADGRYQSDLAEITARFRGASKDFPELAKSEADDIVTGLQKAEFDADSAVDLISILRDKADDAFRTGSSQAGRAYKAGASALERVIERNLQARGRDGADMLAKYRAARQLMAKTYTVEKAFNPSTGNVAAAKLGRELAKGKPLTTELRTAAEFSQAFPKAAREFNESLPGVSPLDFYASGGVSALTREPWYLLYPFARQATRNALLSRTGQRLAVPAGARQPSGPFAAGTANALSLIGQQ